MPFTWPPPVYDAQYVHAVLGLPAPADIPVPEPRPGETIIYYPGLNIEQLLFSPPGKRWLNSYSKQHRDKIIAPEPGYYRIIFPGPSRQTQRWRTTMKELHSARPNWQVTPLLIAVTALLLHLRNVDDDCLQAAYYCAETDYDADGLWALFALVKKEEISLHDHYDDDEPDGRDNYRIMLYQKM